MSQPKRPSAEDLLKQVQIALADSLAPFAGEFETFEDELMKVLMELGRGAVKASLDRLIEAGAAEADGWKVAVPSSTTLITSFGDVKIERPLYRKERNGPTHCPLLGAVGLIRKVWTPRAARVVSETLAELSLARSEALLTSIGGLAPSAASIQRLGVHLSDAWEANRTEFEDAVSLATSIPPEAAIVTVSLDGVMVNMAGGKRAEQKAKARAKGGSGKGGWGYKEASVGVLTFYCAKGNRLSTRSVGRMPESGKQSTKAWLARELAHIRRRCPKLIVVAIADGAPNNWSFLGEIGADYEVVDYFHAAEYVYRLVQRCSDDPNALKTQAIGKRLTKALLEQKGAAPTILKDLQALREKAGRPARSKSQTYFEIHASRLNYAVLREKNIPIGSGVTEGACRNVVVDRLRRTGMRWSPAGGQSVLTLRALKISGDFSLAWPLLKGAVQRAA